ncbi:gastrin/cholecystokinin-like peptide [Sphaeramia orbicularis]|uniref:Gastrin/cholecystokinin-like peptide n=1 Tax=Sphaeramia orbicularis TaxID=375764 RepID=A0A673CFF1_9TELE|nr:gastrin/cholecystokinin-like peptide [Sphaeramia orbicularis]
MYGKGAAVFALLAVLLVSTTASAPERSAPEDADDRNILHKLQTRRDKVRESLGRQDVPSQTARMARRTHLSEDEREIMTKQIMQAISDLMNSECMTDRDYQGWVDFGRRDVEMGREMNV